MTLYRYVPSKDALLDGVVARVLTGLAINPAATDWRQELHCMPTACSSDSCTDTSSTSYRKPATNSTRPTTCSGSACTVTPPRIPLHTRRGPRTRQLRRSRPPPARRRTDDHRPAIPLPASTHQPYHLNTAATSLPAVPQTHRHRVPDGLELHLICDNYATRKTPSDCCAIAGSTSSPRRTSAGPGFRPVRQGKVDSVSLTCKLNV
jgi:AcrR family transcriptional regulator